MGVNLDTLVENREKILITGANSYIGTCVEQYLKSFGDKYTVDTIDLVGAKIEKLDFKGYDTLFHVAGIAHQRETHQNASLYYRINEELAIEVAKKAKQNNVKQFVILSSMSVYGKNIGEITRETVPQPNTHYGRSKYNADREIEEMADNNFIVSILRPPMVYGKECKGNYQLLRKLALRCPLFPRIKNYRSMIYIGNLARFVRNVIDNKMSGVFLPQDAEYVCTAEMVKMIAEIHGKNVLLTPFLNPLVILGQKLKMRTVNKVFGSLYYEKVDCVRGKSFKEIMWEIEGDKEVCE